MIMKSRVLTSFWRISGLPRTAIRILSTKTGDIFEPIPREELVTKFKSRLRDREFLPGSSGGGFPEFLAEPRDSFPLGVRVNNKSQSSLAELTAKCMEYVEKNFSRSPAILFRGLPAETTEDFSVIAKASKMKCTYSGGTGYRTLIDKEAGVATASDDPNEYTIEPHNEQSYMATFPSKVFFFCVKEPIDGCGGETPLVKNSELISRLNPEVVRELEKKQIRYVRYLPNEAPGVHLSWQRSYVTNDRKVAESQAKELGYHVTWDESGGLSAWQNRPAFLTHPVTGEKIWFNQTHIHNASYYKYRPNTFSDAHEIPDEKYPAHTYYGDGSEIEPEVIQHIRATSWACAVGFKWRKGDLLAMDNLSVQHARIGFKGPRKILAFLVA